MACAASLRFPLSGSSKQPRGTAISRARPKNSISVTTGGNDVDEVRSDGVMAWRRRVLTAPVLSMFDPVVASEGSVDP